MGNDMPKPNPADKPAKMGRGPGKPFTKNDPRIPAVRKRMEENGELPPRSGVPPEPAPVDEGVPPQLADMRWVYERPASQDKTQGHKTCRKWLNADPKGFMGHKSNLEARVVALKAGPKEKAPQPEEDVDEGTERALKLCRDYLRRLEDEAAEEDAKFAARPDAAAIGYSLQQQLQGALDREGRWKRIADDLQARVGELEEEARQERAQRRLSRGSGETGDEP
jgi:hypothetical protein